MTLLQMKPKRTIARKLTLWRQHQGWTQVEAASFLGCPVQTYIQWEHGRRTPRGFALTALLERLHECL